MSRLLAWFTLPRRVWLYTVSLAALALLAGYDIVDPSRVPLWSALVVGALGLGTAASVSANQAHRNGRDED